MSGNTHLRFCYPDLLRKGGTLESVCDSVSNMQEMMEGKRD